MTDKELRKLSRGDLLDLLLAQCKETESLQSRLNEANEKLESRRIELLEAGNIAEAALALNGVFESAQAAADQYLETIRENTKHQDEICKAMERECKEKCDKMLADAQAKSDALLASANAQKAESDLLAEDTKARCAAMTAAAEAEAETYWKNISARLEKFYEEHHGLREILLQIGGNDIGKEMKI